MIYEVDCHLHALWLIQGFRARGSLWEILGHSKHPGDKDLLSALAAETTEKARQTGGLCGCEGPSRELYGSKYRNNTVLTSGPTVCGVRYLGTWTPHTWP